MITLICCITNNAWAQLEVVNAQTKIPDHPRLLMLSGEETSIKKVIGADQTWSGLNQALLSECDSIVAAPVLERIQIGRRLLSVSREALRRIFYLSYAWRMTNNQRYLQRAEKEMLAISAFTNWNPSHFLDVAEMTMALSIGYDWLYKGLPVESRTAIKEAILKKGLEPSLNNKNNSWLSVTHNWNQVCNAGMSYGALAIYEDEPVLARKIINRAIETIALPMGDYAPNGVYPEGYGYWGYGTSFNVMFLSAIDKAFGQDFGLSQKPGFLKTAGFMENLTGLSGSPFNYSDSGPTGGLQPAMFWFATKLNDPSLLWVERSRLMNSNPATHMKNRLLPAIMLWNGGIGIQKIGPPKDNFWVGSGINPMVLMRSSWTDTTGIYVAMKGGSVSINHAHMDIGSFVMEADGIRWAMDFGMQEYESLESKGIQLFGRTQDAQRWTVFRYTNLVHNTLTINNRHQRVTGTAPITSSSASPDFMNAITDLSAIYKGAATKAARGIAIANKQYVVVRDEVEATDTVTTIRWTMLTPADVKITGKNTAELTKDGKKLFLKVQEPSNIVMKTWSTDPPNSYDAPNPGTTLVGFEVTIPAKAVTAITVSLVPEKAMNKANKKIVPLKNWNK